MSDLSHAMRQVIHYYSPDTDEEPHPQRRRGEESRDRAFANDVLAAAFEEVARQAYRRGYEAALRERGLLP